MAIRIKNSLDCNLVNKSSLQEFKTVAITQSCNVIVLGKQKIKILKYELGVAEKSQETRKNCWGGNVNHKCLF